MTRFLASLVATIVALALLAAADHLLQPAPVPAATGVVGGVAAVLLTRSWRRVTLGIVSGILVGAAIHGYTHATGRSPPPSGGLWTHVSVDALFGAVLAVAVVAIAAWVNARAVPRGP